MRDSSCTLIFSYNLVNVIYWLFMNKTKYFLGYCVNSCIKRWTNSQISDPTINHFQIFSSLYVTMDYYILYKYFPCNAMINPLAFEYETMWKLRPINRSNFIWKDIFKRVWFLSNYVKLSFAFELCVCVCVCKNKNLALAFWLVLTGPP